MRRCQVAEVVATKLENGADFVVEVVVEVVAGEVSMSVVAEVVVQVSVVAEVVAVVLMVRVRGERGSKGAALCSDLAIV